MGTSGVLRKRAVEGILSELKEGQYLFLNVDPHDFNDPTFRSLDPAELGRLPPDRTRDLGERRVLGLAEKAELSRKAALAERWLASAWHVTRSPSRVDRQATIWGVILP